MLLSRNLGTLTSWNSLGPSGHVTGLLYLLPLPMHIACSSPLIPSYFIILILYCLGVQIINLQSGALRNISMAGGFFYGKFVGLTRFPSWKTTLVICSALIQYICRYPPYQESVSIALILWTYCAVVTGTQLTQAAFILIICHLIA